MPGKFGQDVKDRVLVENLSLQAACELVAPKLRVCRGYTAC